MMVGKRHFVANYERRRYRKDIAIVKALGLRVSNFTVRTEDLTAFLIGRRFFLLFLHANQSLNFYIIISDMNKTKNYCRMRCVLFIAIGFLYFPAGDRGTGSYGT